MTGSVGLGVRRLGHGVRRLELMLLFLDMSPALGLPPRSQNGQSNSQSGVGITYNREHRLGRYVFLHSYKIM